MRASKTQSLICALLFGLAGRPCYAQKILFRFDGMDGDGTLGVAVAEIGDIDGDGIPDLVAGAPLVEGQPGSRDGAAYVYSGATGTKLLTLLPTAQRGFFGGRLAAAGDIDGDGVPDLVVGAPFTSNDEVYGVGSVLVFSGKTGSLLYNFTGTEGGAYMGWSVAGVGDVDGDNVPDIMIGTPYGSGSGHAGAGNVLVRSGANGNVIHRFEGADPGDYLGWSVAAIGDVDGDGIGDLLTGAPGSSPYGLLHAGRVIMRSGATGQILFQLDGDEALAFFGAAIAPIGDLDFDGIPDFAVGAPAASPNGLNEAGSVFVFSGATGDTLLRLDGVAAYDGFGTSVAGGDVDGDGIPDIVVGAPNASPNGKVGAGSVFIFSGATGDLLFRWDGLESGDAAGQSVAVISDLDGDGRAEVMIGEPYANRGAGSAFIVSFSPAKTSSAVSLLPATWFQSHLGQSSGVQENPPGRVCAFD